MRRRSLLDKIEQVVRLIRSKGVGVYFVTQNPLDVPETVLGQLGNRVQHALRAFTPRDQKAVKAAAETMRANPKLDTEKAITELARRRGAGVVPRRQRAARSWSSARTSCRPASRIGPATPDERQRVIAASGLGGVYDKPVDRESAYERLKGRAQARRRRPARRRAAPGGSWTDSVKDSLGGLLSGSGRKDSIVEAVAKSAARTVGSTIGREIVRGVLGSLLGRPPRAERIARCRRAPATGALPPRLRRCRAHRVGCASCIGRRVRRTPHDRVAPTLVATRAGSRHPAICHCWPRRHDRRRIATRHRMQTACHPCSNCFATFR